MEGHLEDDLAAITARGVRDLHVADAHAEVRAVDYLGDRCEESRRCGSMKSDERSI